MARNNILLVGIRPGSASNVKPEGLHLRWFFPPELGFPPGGFEIFRREHEPVAGKLTKLAPLPDDTIVESGLEVQNLRFTLPPATLLTYEHIEASNQSIPRGFRLHTQNNRILTIEFLEPATNVELTFGNGPGLVKAFSGEREVYVETQSQQTYQIPNDGDPKVTLITRLEIQLNFDWLRSVSYSPLSIVCNQPGWGQPVMRLPLPTAVNDLRNRLEAGIGNRYIDDRDQALTRSRYGQRTSEMLEWLLALQRPDLFARRFEDPTASPDRLQFKRDARDMDKPLNVYPQQILLLAALDPNVARMLGLYWVDRYDVANGPKRDTAYDYMVVGRWVNNQKRCGVLFNLGAAESALPASPISLTGEQLAGYTWDGATPLGRVGLRWRNPGGNLATQPVFYDVYRDRVHLTKDRPVLALGPQPEVNPAYSFIDPQVVISPGRVYRYRVASIDLFGQVGKESEELRLDHLQPPAPPPPIRLQTWQPDPTNNPGKVWVQFEFGAHEHIQAPNVSSFRLHRRGDAMRPTLRLRVRAVQERIDNGRPMVLVQLEHSQPGGPAAPPLSALLKSFEGGVASWVNQDTHKRLPAKQRRHYRIAGVVENPPGIQIEPPFERLDAGQFELLLAADPRLNQQWLSLPNDSQPEDIPDVPPITGLLSQAPSLELGVKILAVTKAGPRSDPFTVLQQDPSLKNTLPSSFPDLPVLPKVVEVEIDRALLDPDVFVSPDAIPGDFTKNGTASSDRGSFRIAYVSPGGVGVDGKNQGARLGLLDEPALVKEQSLRLTPRAELRSSTMHDQVRCLTIAKQLDSTRMGIAGGEILLDSTRNDRTPLVGQVVSSAANQSGTPETFDLLVRFPAEQPLDAFNATAQISYYIPYRKELDFDLGSDDPSNGKALKIPDGKGTRTAYLAANSRSSLNSEGPLSLPVPFTVVRPAPKGKPGKPYPCGANAAAREGYATPPDLQGRATIDLCWGAGNLTPATGLRYEVARALDSTIIATHLRNWQMGKAPAAAAILPSVQPLIRATLSLVPPAPGQPDPAASRGVMRVSFGQVPQNANAELFRGARLVDRNGEYFQVTLAKRNGDTFDLLLRSASGKRPDGGDATLEAPPDYADALQDAHLLVSLAPTPTEEEPPQNPSERLLKGMATPFGMVTGVPIETTEFSFIDEVPGKGEGRYFYRVRGVDAAGNVSEWSDVSVPFHTVDTTPPEAVRQLQVFPGDRTATLVWPAPTDKTISGYRVFRTEGEAPIGLPNLTTSPYRELALSDIRFRPIAIHNNRVALPGNIRDVVATQTEVKRYPATAHTTNLLVTNTALTLLHGRRVSNINPLVPDGSPVRVVIGNQDSPQVLSHRPGTEEPLTVRAGTIDLSFGLTITSIESLLFAESVRPDSDLETLVTYPSLLQETGVEALVGSLTISGLSDAAPDGVAVTAIVRLADGSLRAIRKTPGTIDPLTVQNGRVLLDRDIPDGSLLGVFAQTSDATAPSSTPDSDLRLTQVSRVEIDSTSKRAVAIHDLNPLVPDGAEVEIILTSIDGARQIISGDPQQFSWTDTRLKGGQTYRYALAALREITVESSGTPPILERRPLIGAYSRVVQARGLDRSAPELPTIRSLTWVDANTNVLATASTQHPAVSIQLRSTITPEQIKVERRSGATEAWRNAPLDHGRGWFGWPAGVEEIVAIDREANPNRPWEYRALLRTADARISSPSQAVQLAALHPEGEVQ